MEILEAIKFFGLPPRSKDLDQFLMARGIAERPMFNGEPTELINRFKEGFSLAFRARHGYEREWGPAREEGEMIFSSLQVYSENNDSGFLRFSGQLPYGLTFASTLKEAVAIFGNPTVDYESGDEHAYVWYNHHGYTVTISFLQSDRGISFFAIEKDMKTAPEKMDW